MPDTFAITVLFIAFSTVVAAFVRGRHKDKCLLDFSGDRVSVIDKDGKSLSGILSVESTGSELKYNSPVDLGEGYIESSHILYKNEYANIQTIIRYQDELDEKSKTKRIRELKKTYHPNFFRRSGRKIHNFFSTVKDSVMEIVNLLLGKAGKLNKFGSVVSSQGKYINQMKQGVAGSVSTSFEPLFEKHIGTKVIIDLYSGEKLIKYTGILKDYTQTFIEIMDVSSRKDNEDNQRVADLLIPRSNGTVRHLGE